MGSESLSLIDQATRPRRSGGRPTRDDAARRDLRILDAAAELFLAQGFDLAALDTLADTAGISKATLYARFGDKKRLFITVLQREIERWLAPLSTDVEAIIAAGEPQSAEATLLTIGRQMTQRSLEPRVVALGRVISMQAPRFPELAQFAHNEGWLRAVEAIVRLLKRFEARGEIILADPEIAADLLLNLVLGRIVRSAAYGIPIDAKALERRLQAAIKLFLYGVTPNV